VLAQPAASAVVSRSSRRLLGDELEGASFSEHAGHRPARLAPPDRATRRNGHVQEDERENLRAGLRDSQQRAGRGGRGSVGVGPLSASRPGSRRCGARPGVPLARGPGGASAGPAVSAPPDRPHAHHGPCVGVACPDPGRAAPSLPARLRAGDPRSPPWPGWQRHAPPSPRRRQGAPAPGRGGDDRCESGDDHPARRGGRQPAAGVATVPAQAGRFPAGVVRGQLLRWPVGSARSSDAAAAQQPLCFDVGSTSVARVSEVEPTAFPPRRPSGQARQWPGASATRRRLPRSRQAWSRRPAAATTANVQGPGAAGCRAWASVRQAQPAAVVARRARRGRLRPAGRSCRVQARAAAARATRSRTDVQPGMPAVPPGRLGRSGRRCGGAGMPPAPLPGGAVRRRWTSPDL